MTALSGHLWTVGPYLQNALFPTTPPHSEQWSAQVMGTAGKRIRITGRLTATENADAIVIVIHGLGGSSSGRYMVKSSTAASALGMASLRLNLRGADRRGEDFYHAGLTEDLQVAIDSPAVQAYDKVYILGFSLGGHMALRYATLDLNRKVVAIATVCAPVDLAAGAQEIDQDHCKPYRRNVLHGLKEIYTEVARRNRVPIAVDDAYRIDTIRQWDDRIVAPHHGFADAQDYWSKMCVSSRLDRLALPCLFIASENDPMVFAHTIRPALRNATLLSPVFTPRGGHVSFPKNIDLGLGLEGDIYTQALTWLGSAS